MQATFSIASAFWKISNENDLIKLNYISSRRVFYSTAAHTWYQCTTTCGRYLWSLSLARDVSCAARNLMECQRYLVNVLCLIAWANSDLYTSQYNYQFTTPNEPTPPRQNEIVLAKRADSSTSHNVKQADFSTVKWNWDGEFSHTAWNRNLKPGEDSTISVTWSAPWKANIARGKLKCNIALAITNLANQVNPTKLGDLETMEGLRNRQ